MLEKVMDFKRRVDRFEGERISLGTCLLAEM